jgi:ribosomal protein S18 acetylase RimI-like enzyme
MQEKKMIRKIKQADIEELKNILEKIPHFTQEEVEVAMELIIASANDSLQSDYNTFVYEKDNKILGYHCTGKRPLTDGTYDLYWIVADPFSSEKGTGKQLLDHAENFVKENNGRWLLAETSSKENYLAVRKFYLRNNYTILSEINDFYSLGDNLIIFGKYFY